MNTKTKIHRAMNNSNYSFVSNELLRREDISWKAKGILVYILSLPPDCKIDPKEIQQHSNDGVTSFQSGWNELKNKGFINRVPIRENGKIVTWTTKVNLER